MKRKRWLIGTSLGLIGLCLFILLALALSNRSLPTHSQITERLSEAEKARLAEAIHLRQALGDAAWPGWTQMDTPIIVYNEANAFLVNAVSQPPDGWLRMPQEQRLGGPWEAVPGDLFSGQVYYRQPLPDPNQTPENFTVRLGEVWAATMFTREYAEVDLYANLKAQLPPGLRSFFPYRVMWALIMGDTAIYISALEHESFHAMQGSLASERLADAEYANQQEGRYPWDEASLETSWQAEMDILIQAVRADTAEQAADLGRQFLDMRIKRRVSAGLDETLIDFERQREWLEGLAKYAELQITRLAGTTASYQPLAALEIDPDFKAYANQERYWQGQLDEATRTAGREGETRFYYSGMAQAALLDRLLPGWKEKAFAPGVMQEDLLREALANP